MDLISDDDQASELSATEVQSMMQTLSFHESPHGKSGHSTPNLDPTEVQAFQEFIGRNYEQMQIKEESSPLLAIYLNLSGCFAHKLKHAVLAEARGEKHLTPLART